MSEPGSICLLEDLGLMRIHGPEALQFLQGQLSNDISLLSAASVQRAGLHNPQGRTLALLWLVRTAPHDISAILPLELLPAIAASLRRYVLRAKLSISDETAQYRILGASAASSKTVGGARFAYHGDRVLLIDSVTAPPPIAAMTREHWRALDIAAGLPQVYAATSGQFVAQMLNLDCIDAVSFTKGCYTGQEVIARAHYRGRVKRRMQRFLSSSPLRLQPGDAARLADGRNLRVVEAVQRQDGHCEFLAVAPWPGATPDAEDSGAARGSASLLCESLPLPYALPA